MESDPTTGAVKGPSTADQIKAWKKQLTRVKLRSLSATPASVAPYSDSLIAWDVDLGGVDGVTLDLDGAPEPPKGSVIATTNADRLFTLTAALGSVKTTLGAVALRLDTSACHTVQLDGDSAKILVTLGLTVAMSQEGFTLDSCDVGLEAAGITISFTAHSAALAVGGDVTFTLAAADGNFSSTVTKIHTSADFPQLGFSDVAALIQVGVEEAARLTLHKDLVNAPQDFEKGLRQLAGGGKPFSVELGADSLIVVFC